MNMLDAMENSRGKSVMFRPFASLGLFLCVVAAHTSGIEAASTDQLQPLTAPAGDTQRLSPKGHVGSGSEVRP